jgi:WD40 repeat protein
MMLFDKDVDDQNYTIPTTTDDYFYRAAPSGSKNNPRAYFKVSRKSITSLAFSPDFQHLAVTAMDGSMTILDYLTGKRSDVYQSYFGGMLCACWSPDGKYIVAGSQDDLLSIYAFRGRLLVRCQGHFAWVLHL